MKKNMNSKLLFILLVAVLAISLFVVVACDDVNPPADDNTPPTGDVTPPADDKSAANITAEFEHSHTVYKGDYLGNLYQYFTVIYTDENGQSNQVRDFELIGSFSLILGENKVVVKYNDLMTLVAVNAVNRPTVTFVADGKVVEVKEYSKYDLTILNVPRVPYKTGYSGEWEEYTLTEDSGNIIVNAVYTANTYVVLLDYNGAEVNDSVQAITATYGQPIGTLPTPTLTDYDFLGWYYNDILINADDIWTRNIDCTLVAKWKPSKFDSYGLAYSLNDDKESYSVVGWGDAISSVLTIPQTYLGKSVTAIANSAFRNCSVLTSVIISNGIIKIGASAFIGCVNLTNITISASVATIYTSPFENCPSLENITVEQQNAYYHSSGNCLIETETATLVSGCKNSVIPTDGSVKAIGNSAFMGSGITELVMPDSVTSIGNCAFQDCTSLKSAVVSNGVKSISNIGFWIFYGCTALEKVTLGSNMPIIRFAMFQDCTSLKTIIIPQSVKYIWGDAFTGCSNLESVVILSDYENFTIANNAFEDCDKFSSIYYCGTEEQWNNNVRVKDSVLENVTVYFYSEETPALNEDGTDYDGNYWHWDMDLPAKWELEN